jgi:hypothetical protein
MNTHDRSSLPRPNREAAPPPDGSQPDTSELYALIFGDSALDARARAYDRVRRMLRDNPHCAPGIARALSDHLHGAESGGESR